MHTHTQARENVGVEACRVTYLSCCMDYSGSYYYLLVINWGSFFLNPLRDDYKLIIIRTTCVGLSRFELSFPILIITCSFGLLLVLCPSSDVNDFVMNAVKIDFFGSCDILGSGEWVAEI